jgi:hypothetical protein
MDSSIENQIALASLSKSLKSSIKEIEERISYVSTDEYKARTEELLSDISKSLEKSLESFRPKKD